MSGTQVEQRVVLVTGAGTGIGRAVAHRFADEGSQVVVVGRTEDTLRETAAHSPLITYLRVDLEDSDDLARLLAEIDTRHGRLDVLVNNAGWAPVTPISQATMSEYDRVFGINVRALVDLTTRALPLLKKSRGSVINMSSVIVKNHLPNMSLYAGTKAAVEIFTKIWAKELAADGIRVNSIGVGPIETPIYDKTGLSADGVDEHVQQITRAIPMGRFGTPEQVAGVAVFLASEDAAYVTGSDYPVDGGFGA